MIYDGAIKDLTMLFLLTNLLWVGLYILRAPKKMSSILYLLRNEKNSNRNNNRIMLRNINANEVLKLIFNKLF